MRTILLVVGVWLMCVGAPAAAWDYDIVDLGRITMTGGGAKDVNARNEVVYNNDGYVFIWNAGNVSPPGGILSNGANLRI